MFRFGFRFRSANLNLHLDTPCLPLAAVARIQQVLTARAPFHVQAGLSDKAAKEQEGHRGYLLRRLVPAMAAYYSATGWNAAGEPAHDMLAAHVVEERLAALTTRQLEARLARFHAVLLTVRTATALGGERVGHTALVRTRPGSVVAAFHVFAPLQG